MSFALLLAAMLSQTCPTPSPGSPPPCAAANVPGCLPGYVARYDRSGRPIYVCDPVFWSAVPPPVPWSDELQPAPQTAAEQRPNLAIVFMPGVTTFPSGTQIAKLDRGTFSAQVALELRGQRGSMEGLRLRFTGEYTSFGRIGEVSIKYDLDEGGAFRPFLAFGVGAASVDPDRAGRLCGSGSVGVDLYVNRDVFLTAELRARRFADREAGTGRLVISGLRQTSGLVGLGVYL